MLDLFRLLVTSIPVQVDVATLVDVEKVWVITVFTPGHMILLDASLDVVSTACIAVMPTMSVLEILGDRRGGRDSPFKLI